MGKFFIKKINKVCNSLKLRIKLTTTTIQITKAMLIMGNTNCSTGNLSQFQVMSNRGTLSNENDDNELCLTSHICYSNVQIGR